jgi:hypothetical protein
VAFFGNLSERDIGVTRREQIHERTMTETKLSMRREDHVHQNLLIGITAEAALRRLAFAVALPVGDSSVAFACLSKIDRVERAAENLPDYRAEKAKRNTMRRQIFTDRIRILSMAVSAPTSCFCHRSGWRLPNDRKRSSITS